MLLEMLKSENEQDVILALVSDPEACIELMNNGSTEVFDKYLHIHRDIKNPFRTLIVNGYGFAFSTGDFIALVKRSEYHLLKDRKDTVYTDNSII